jgi:hypothetical protein
VLLETTGLADPGPIAEMFWLDDALCSVLKLDGIISVVDVGGVLKRLFLYLFSFSFNGHFDCSIPVVDVGGHAFASAFAQGRFLSRSVDISIAVDVGGDLLHLHSLEGFFLLTEMQGRMVV